MRQNSKREKREEEKCDSIWCDFLLVTTFLTFICRLWLLAFLFRSLSCSLVPEFRFVTHKANEKRYVVRSSLVKMRNSLENEHYMPARNWIILCDYIRWAAELYTTKIKIYIRYMRRAATYHGSEPSFSELNHCARHQCKRHRGPLQHAHCIKHISDFNNNCAPIKVPLAWELHKSSQSYWMLIMYLWLAKCCIRLMRDQQCIDTGSTPCQLFCFVAGFECTSCNLHIIVGKWRAGHIYVCEKCKMSHHMQMQPDPCSTHYSVHNGE